MLNHWPATLIPRQGRKEAVTKTSTSFPVLSLVWITLGILDLVWGHWNRRKRVFKGLPLYYSLLLCISYCLRLKICSRKAIRGSKFIKRAASLTLLLRLDETFIWYEWIIFVGSDHLLAHLFIDSSSMRLKLLLAIDDICWLANSSSCALLQTNTALFLAYVTLAEMRLWQCNDLTIIRIIYWCHYCLKLLHLHSPRHNAIIEKKIRSKN